MSKNKPKINRLIWDIETSPNVAFLWRTGYKLNVGHHNILKERAIICICYKWEGEKKVYSLKWDMNQSDKELCRKFLKVIDSADEIVAHNGDRFDLPMFNGRCLINKLDPSGIPKTVDTLSIARRRFRLNSNKLDYISKMLGHGGKLDTNYDMWKKILLKNDRRVLSEMVEYCKKDVVINEKVFHELNKYHNNKTHVGVVEGRDRWTCPNCGSDHIHSSGSEVRLSGNRRHKMKCKSCGKNYLIAENVFRDFREAKYDENQRKSKKTRVKARTRR